MTDINYLEKTISINNKKLENDSVWIKAFKYYNSNNPDRKLSMKCNVCYSKVLNYIKAS